MIIEHRTYTLYPGKAKRYLELCQFEGLPIQLKYLPRPLGYFVSELGALNQIVHMWGYASLDERQSLRAEMRRDEAWLAYVDKILPLIQTQESKILIPAAFCKPVIHHYEI